MHVTGVRPLIITPPRGEGLERAYAAVAISEYDRYTGMYKI